MGQRRWRRRRRWWTIHDGDGRAPFRERCAAVAGAQLTGAPRAGPLINITWRRVGAVVFRIIKLNARAPRRTRAIFVGPAEGTALSLLAGSGRGRSRLVGRGDGEAKGGG